MSSAATATLKSAALRCIYCQYSRLRYFVINAIQELSIYETYIKQYQIYLINCNRRYVNLFNITNNTSKIRVTDATLVNGNITSPTIDVLQLIKKIVKNVIDHTPALLRYINSLRGLLHVLVTGLMYYRQIYNHMCIETRVMVQTKTSKEPKVPP